MEAGIDVEDRDCAIEEDSRRGRKACGHWYEARGSSPLVFPLETIDIDIDIDIPTEDPNEVDREVGRRPSRTEEEKEDGKDKGREEERPSTASWRDALRRESGTAWTGDGSEGSREEEER